MSDDPGLLGLCDTPKVYQIIAHHLMKELAQKKRGS